MCGGDYKAFKTPKQLSLVKGERVVDRTIRLLKENNVNEIFISSNNPMFDMCNVPRLEHQNNFIENKGQCKGYWLDAFYPIEEKTRIEPLE